MKLLTFNTLFRQSARSRLRGLADQLERDDYDIVCLQEFLYRHNLPLVRRLFPHRAASGAVLLKGGLVMMSRWPIARAKVTPYPVAGPPRPDFLMRKGAQVARVRAPDGDLAVVNTHLTFNRDGDWSPESRYGPVLEGELRRLASLIARIPADFPVVAVGDFNVHRESPLLKKFAAASGVRDLMAGDARPTFRPEPGSAPFPPIDHVFVRGLTGSAEIVFQDRVRLADGRREYLSDHYGIAADLHPR
ncbi:endonuclease/exonuclease/phosphatase family protein [Spirillospora sp. NPDC048911]|uniref:endonuclease/exonuclease/phosphatase family protein n=1 Tax=Spirillospora sp. NPDC048911 TaxID=3364527 RepID=UPI003716C1A3